MHPFIYLSPPALPVHLMWTPNSDHIQLYPTGKSCSKPLGPMWNLPPGSHLQLELDLLRMLCASDRPSLTKRSPATAGQGAQLDEMGNISFPYPVKLTHAKPPLKNAWIKLGHFLGHMIQDHPTQILDINITTSTSSNLWIWRQSQGPHPASHRPRSVAKWDRYMAPLCHRKGPKDQVQAVWANSEPWKGVAKSPGIGSLMLEIYLVWCRNSIIVWDFGHLQAPLLQTDSLHAQAST